MGRIRRRSHDNNHLLRIFGSDVIEQVVLASYNLGELVHRLLYDLRNDQIIFIHRLPALEINVGILRRAANHGPVRRKSPHLMPGNEVFIDHRTHIIQCQLFDLLHLMTCPETIEEVQKRQTRSQSGLLSDQCHIHDFLNTARSEHRKTRLSTGHDIRMIAEDRQRLTR